MPEGTWPPTPESLGPAEHRLARDAELSDREIWRSHVLSKPGTRLVQEGDYYLHSYPLPVRPLNELRVTGTVRDVRRVLKRATEFFAEVSTTWRVILSQDQLADWEATLQSAGFARELDIPVLVLPSDRRLPIDPTPGLVLHRVEGAEDLRRFQHTFNEVSQDPDGYFWEKSQFLENPNLDFYLAELNGIPCATGIGQTEHGLTGIWGIVTSPRQRRQGVGSAVTRAVVEGGVTRGATGAHLWSSEMGFPVYRRLGFRHVENRVSFSFNSGKA